jgi:glycosyltransferase involved in cell wall biosynthesis
LTGTDHGNLAHVRQVAGDLGLEQRVHFPGFVPGSHMKVLYRHAAALVFPSFFGPDNLPPLEAFALGCPVIAARIEGVEDQLGGSAAAFFDPTQPEEIASAIKRVLSDAFYSAALIESGGRIAAERTPGAYVQGVLQTLDSFERYRLNWPSGAHQP